MEKTLSAEEFARLPTPEKNDMIGKMYDGAMYFDLGAPVIADADRIVVPEDWVNGGTVDTKTLTIAAQPDVPRNLTVLLTDANNSCTGTLTITGKDIAGRTVTEVMTPDGLGGGKTLTGTKVFASVTSAVVVGKGGTTSTDQIQIGVGNKIGLPVDIDASAAVTFCSFNSVPVSPTIATGVSTSSVDASAGTYDGAKILKVAVRPTKRV